jgi:hypothetical protein
MSGVGQDPPYFYAAGKVGFNPPVFLHHLSISLACKVGLNPPYRHAG